MRDFSAVQIKYTIIILVGYIISAKSDCFNNRNQKHKLRDIRFRHLHGKGTVTDNKLLN